MLGLDFMRNAFIAGTCIAMAAGLVGYFIVLRNQTFAADALGHTAFTGSLAGVLAGLNAIAGAAAACVGVALAIGSLGGRGRGRDVAIGTVFAWVLGVGVLLLSVYTASRSAASGGLGIAVLFGSILSLQPTQVAVSSILGFAIVAVVVAVARPLLLLSVDPDVAVTRGVPARGLTLLFLVLIAMTTAEAVQAVGALLTFALMVTPAAIAQNVTARPWLGMALAAIVAVALVWVGLVLSFYLSYPASFFITALAFAAYVASRLPRRAALVAVAVVLGSCGLSAQPAARSATVHMVAAESFWGSIAAQVGGDRVSVTSIVANPAVDPHDYDPTPADARLMAEAGYVIVDGAGYDAWATRLLEANQVAGRRVLNVADLVGKRAGDNPHFWYSPAYVDRVVARLGADLGVPERAATYGRVALREYHDAIAAIASKHRGTSVGATESIFAYLADATGLALITPPAYLNAVSTGTDPSAADKATVQRQIATRQIRVLVFNAQNSTPEVQGIVERARANGIPVVRITETMTPASATFEAWQTAQLDELLHALGD